MVLECLAGVISTGAFGVILRRQLLTHAMGNDELIGLLRRRGVDMEDAAMQSHLSKTYETLEMLGEGVSGAVWKVKKKKTGEHFAMKVIKKHKGNGAYVADRALETEINCLRKLRHRHIVNIMDSIESNRNLWIVMECAEGGGLYERIVQLSHYTERSAARVVKQVLQAVHYMHSYGVVHRDLKPENILLTSEKEDADIKVADFGLAVVLEKGLQSTRIDASMRMKAFKGITEGFCGSPICMAPEVASRTAAYGPQCDIWSIGCITFEMLSGNPPFNAPTAPELFRLIHTVKGPNFNDDEVWLDVSEDAKDLIVSMLQRSPESRVSAREALDSAWFRRAPNTHMGRAHDAITRRVTSQATAATTDTLFPPSRAVSAMSRTSVRSRMSCAGRDLDEDADVTSSTATKIVLRTNNRRTMDSDATRILSSHSIQSFQTAAITRNPSHEPEEAPEPDDAPQYLSVECKPPSKVFRICAGGLQQAAWSEVHKNRRTAHT